ncbi:F0F1 ATP synthase subunit B [Cyanobium sp. Morenito 9A2]|uniref:F0F1 ATP synthase subunit B n=1 Tax=Cyanobium sp. Morenito 9A2 TaxID=2823718 RepID=UPI0020CF4525|nr:F0F1 ATP synthase subunit B [Cyanobium sp. Morenito 9A2]MCP9849140.1 F0F1 ATP synthase subunit B [Cyanobium sp. Morenito 9A2]
MTALLDPLLASHGSFGFNLDPFETNIINLAIVIAGLWKFLPGFLGSILERRRTAILADLGDAEDRLTTAGAALAQAQRELAEAQQKAAQIRSDGEARAQAIRLDSERRTVEEMVRVKQGAASDLSTEAARVTQQLRREAARLAIEKALAELPGRLDGAAQSSLLDQSIANLGAS